MFQHQKLQRQRHSQLYTIVEGGGFGYRFNYLGCNHSTFQVSHRAHVFLRSCMQAVVTSAIAESAPLVLRAWPNFISMSCRGCLTVFSSQAAVIL